MKWWIDRRVTGILLLILLLLLSIGVVSYRSFVVFQETAQWTQRSQAGIARLEGLLAQLHGAETGQRDYLLTGDDRFLHPYRTAIESIRHHLESLETLTQDDPTLQQHLVRLKPLIADKFIELQQAIALRDQQVDAATLELMQIDREQQIMAKIQSIVQVMEAEAHRAFAQRSQVAQRDTRRIGLLLLAESLTVAVLLAGVILKMNRDVSRYHRIHQTLQAAETTFRRALVDVPIPMMPHAEAGQVSLLSHAWTELTGYTEADVPLLSEWLEYACGQCKDLMNDLEEELEQRVAQRTADLEQANAALEAFSRTVAHDLYAPLRTIQSFAEILLQETDPLDEIDLSSIQRIYSAAQRMEAFIQDLLIYSRLERADLPLQPVNLTLLMPQVLSDLEDLIQQHQAEIEVVEPLMIVRANPIALMQAITNLLTNALKFVPADRLPQIRIWTEAIPDKAIPDEAMIRLTVQDNGIGIATEDQERIFSIFERLHPAELFPGSGIGLAIVQKAVDRMAGRVGVESEPERGSRFWLELPTMIKSVELSSGEPP